MLLRTLHGLQRHDEGFVVARWKGSDVTWMPPEPMLSTPVPTPDLRPGWAAEPKSWRGFLVVRCPMPNNG